jgi:hypothetical protein
MQPDIWHVVTFPECKKILTPSGIYIMIGHDHFGSAVRSAFGSIPRMLKLMLKASFEKALFGSKSSNREKQGTRN